MPQPIAIHVFDNLMLGVGVSSGLERLGYQVQRVENASRLAHQAAEVKPFLVLIDLTIRTGDADAAIRAIKGDAALKHIRILAYGDHKNEAQLDAARQAGADAVTSNNAIASHLAELVQQVLA